MQQVRLHHQWQLADIFQEKNSSMAEFQLSTPLAKGSGKRALGESEEFAFYISRRRNLQFTLRKRLSRRGEYRCSKRAVVFAGSRLFNDQYRHIHICYIAD
jgi:hypothetical protein